MGVFGRRLEVVVAEQHADLIIVDSEGQLQPVLYQMFLMGTRAADHALGGLALLDGAAVGGNPIVMLVAPIQILNKKSGYFAVIDFTEPCAGQPDAAARLIGT